MTPWSDASSAGSDHSLALSTETPVVLQGSRQAYAGAAKTVRVTTASPGLPVAATDNGLAIAPGNAGLGLVAASATDGQRRWRTTGTLRILPAGRP